MHDPSRFREEERRFLCLRQRDPYHSIRHRPPNSVKHPPLTRPTDARAEAANARASDSRMPMYNLLCTARIARRVACQQQGRRYATDHAKGQEYLVRTFQKTDLGTGLALPQLPDFFRCRKDSSMGKDSHPQAIRYSQLSIPRAREVIALE
ncbi:hypothetical protein C0993_005225 [Termitomyces sp. T159_Od127]|nr:hypothetical protein C0993_005225 [Termitomyces sp. T159_Od127]